MSTETKKATGILIAGEAGQGSILMGVMLAETAAQAGKEVSQSARYGAAVRAGQATASVLISDDAIDFPEVDEPDYLIATAQSTYEKYTPHQAKGTMVIYDPFFIKSKKLPGIRQFAIPATDGALQAFKKQQGSNVILLSALAQLTGVVSFDNLKARIEKMPPKFIESNLIAQEIGVKLAKEAKEE